MMTHSPASSAAGLTKRLRVLSLLGGAVLMLAGTATSQAAITPSNVDPWQHIVDCAAALFSNPAEHAKYCSPGPEPMDLRTNFLTKGDPSPPVTPPPPPPPPEDCVECD